MAVGPPTNIARFIVEFPDDFGRIAGLMVMDGHVVPDWEGPEYNAGRDPRATRTVLGPGEAHNYGGAGRDPGMPHDR